MTVTDWFNKRKGQVLLVPGADPSEAGQCAQAADYWLNEGLGLAYVWANAKDWWNLPGSLAGNFDQITDGFKAGDFVIYSGSLPGSGGYGHIDVVAQDGSKSNYVGYDSNWGGNKTLHQVTHNGSENQYILGSLRRKGSDMSTIGDVEARILIKHIYGYTSEADIESAVPALLGKESNTVIRSMDASPTAAAYQQQIQDWQTGGDNYAPVGQLFVKK